MQEVHSFMLILLNRKTALKCETGHNRIYLQEVFIMADIEKMENMISDEMMEEAAGGKSSKEDWTTVRCHVASGYLALRSKPEYKASNEIAKIYNGETLKVQLSNRSGAYLWAKYEGKQGWVNGDYVRK